MKQKSLFSNLIIGFTSVILIASCSRDVASPQQYSQGQSTSGTINLVADHWQQQGGQPVYTNAFSGVLPAGTTSTQVYLMTGSNEALISSGSVIYMGGEIWATTNGSNVTIIYRSFYQKSLPFQSLDIKVVFE